MRQVPSITTILALLTLCSCSGAGVDGPGLPGSSPNLPFPPPRNLSVLRQGSWDGNDVSSSSTGAVDEGGPLLLDAAASQLEYAIYAFNPIGGCDHIEVELANGNGSSSPQAWLGLADYSQGSWSFTAASEPVAGTQSLSVDELKHDSADGSIFFAVVVSQGQSVRINTVSIFHENTAPGADFFFGPDQQINPLKLEYMFGANASYDPDGGLLTYNWDFDGDGLFELMDGGLTPVHSYASVGVYHPSLQVVDDAGETALSPVKDLYCPSAWSSVCGVPGSTTRQSPFVGPQTNAVKWTFTMDNDVESGPVIGADGTIYVGDDGGTLRALKPNGNPTPDVKWSFFPNHGDVYCTPAVGASGRVYVIAAAGWLYALEDNGTSTPDIAWSYEFIGGCSCSPVLDSAENVYTTSTDGYVRAFHDNGTTTPDVLWSFQTDGPCNTAPAIGPDGILYCGSTSGTAYALKDNGTATPDLIWSYHIAADTGFNYVHPEIGPEGNVYFTNMDGLIYALHDNGTATPDLVWSFDLGGENYGSPALGPDGTVYIGADNDTFYALRGNGTASPDVIWSLSGVAGFDSAPVIGADGTVYVACWDGNILALQDNGTPTPTTLWSYTTGAEIWSYPAIGPDGTLYCGSSDHKVYAIGP